MPEAISLMDLQPKTEKVNVGDDKFLVVKPVTAETVFVFMTRFPDFQRAFVGREMNEATVMAFGPDIIGAVCAAGLGYAGDAAAEQRCRDLPFEIQMDILNAVGRVSFTEGFGPFVRKLRAMLSLVSGVVGKAPDMRSPMPSPPSVVPQTPPSGS